MATLVTKHFSTGVSERAMARMTRQQLGEFGESFAMKIFAARGYTAKQAVKPGLMAAHGDIDVWYAGQSHVWSVEVKTARPHHYNGKPRWQFGLYKRGKTDHKKAHFTMLQAIDCNLAYVFLFPSVLLDAQMFTLTSHPVQYSGRMSAFLMPEDFTITYVQAVVLQWLPK